MKEMTRTICRDPEAERIMAAFPDHLDPWVPPQSPIRVGKTNYYRVILDGGTTGKDESVHACITEGEELHISRNILRKLSGAVRFLA